MARTIALTLIVGMLAVPTLADEDEFEVLKQDMHKMAAGKAKVTAKQAIEAAAKEAGNARVSGVGIGMKGDTPIFEVAFLTDAAELQVTVDAVSGKVLGKEEEKPDADESDEFKQTFKALGDAKVTLAQAIETAMNEAKGGAVVEAEVQAEDGKGQFDVVLMVGEAFKAVKLGADGKVTKVEERKAEGQAWTFDRDAAGKPPAGWKFGFTNPSEGKATWTVTKDDKAMSGPNVVTLDAKSGGGTFNLAMAEKTAYKEVDVRTRLRPNTGQEDQGGGVIWRCKDENNYYICRMNPLENNFRVYRVTGGKRETLQSVELKAEAGKWHVVRAKMVGSHIQCYVDGMKLLDANDDTIKDAGMVGLWTKADASSSFDNIAVRTGKASKSDAAAAKPGEGGKKEGDDDDDDDDHAPPAPKKP